MKKHVPKVQHYNCILDTATDRC